MVSRFAGRSSSDPHATFGAAFSELTPRLLAEARSQAARRGILNPTDAEDIAVDTVAAWFVAAGRAWQAQGAPEPRAWLATHLADNVALFRSVVNNKAADHYRRLLIPISRVRRGEGTAEDGVPDFMITHEVTIDVPRERCLSINKPIKDSSNETFADILPAQVAAYKPTEDKDFLVDFWNYVSRQKGVNATMLAYLKQRKDDEANDITRVETAAHLGISVYVLKRLEKRCERFATGFLKHHYQ